MIKTNIIVVRFNNPDVEYPCIQSIKDNTDIKDYNLVNFDNYPHNHNIGQLWNILISGSNSEYICLLNSDTTVTEGWLPKLIEVFKKKKDAGIVGPSTDHSKNHQSKEVEDEGIIDFSKFICADGKPEVLSGFCILFPKKVWEEAGGFPEDYGFYGQEVAFIDKILELGYNQYWRRDVFVHHEGSATVKKMEAERKFNEKAERIAANNRRR